MHSLSMVDVMERSKAITKQAQDAASPIILEILAEQGFDTEGVTIVFTDQPLFPEGTGIPLNPPERIL